ncbi:hypothetical protein CHUAL_009552 [Chamberlinius hualienensis]
MKKFAVVHFVRDNSVDFVPSLWLFNDKRTCFYPKFRFPEFEALKRNYECVPQKGWISCIISKAENKASNYLLNSDTDSSECELRYSTTTIETVNSVIDDTFESSLKLPVTPSQKSTIATDSYVHDTFPTILEAPVAPPLTYTTSIVVSDKNTEVCQPKTFFPLGNIDDLYKLESYLLESPSNYKNIVRLLSQVGGMNFLEQHLGYWTTYLNMNLHFKYD